MDEWKTPENKWLQMVFGPTISIKEALITAAAIVILGGFVGLW